MFACLSLSSSAAAELPKGFPGYTPVGRIEVKHYPAYRKATVSGTAGFWTLFNQIKQNHIAMTAPVEMDYGEPLPQNVGERSMAFPYGPAPSAMCRNLGGSILSSLWRYWNTFTISLELCRE